MAESQRATHRALLPYELVDGCLCAATTHAEVLEQKSWFEFDMSLARRARPSASNEAQPLFRTFVGPAEKKRRPPVIQRNSGDPIFFCTLLEALERE